MQSIEMGGLEKFTKELNDLLDEIPEARQKLHEELADMIKKEVDTQIIASGVKDTHGKIRRWQERHVGSKGGYAAVRATDSSTGDNSPGAITNYLESGHKIRTPSGKAKYYKPKARVPYVEGWHFYQNARKTVESEAIKLAEKFAENLAKRIEGGLKS